MEVWITAKGTNHKRDGKIIIKPCRRRTFVECFAVEALE